MNTSYSEQMLSSSSFSSISLSASLPDLVTSTSLSSSSSRGDSDGLLSISTTSTSVQDLHAIANSELYNLWTKNEPHLKDTVLPFAHAAQDVVPLPTRLRRSVRSARRSALRVLEGWSPWNVVVAAVFCVYLSVLLCAFAGYNAGDNRSLGCHGGFGTTSLASGI